ncbi:MAG TPA: hypothetical protein VLJ59_20145 [Mycobacteriales bacterium]|nr:hypothetical protein [Mycobacteriales bacterium]
MTELTVLAEEGPITLGFPDLVRYHGHAALAMLAVTFRAQEAAFGRLCPDGPPRRDAIEVRSGHPGPGVRDAFEMVTRCVTRRVYTVDPELPGPRYNPRGPAVYAFEITVAGRGSQHVAVRPGVLPDEFFDYLAAGAGGNASAEVKLEFAALRRRIADVVLVTDLDQLFECEYGALPAR